MQAIGAHPDLQGLRRWSLVTSDAHALYRQFGFRELASPEKHKDALSRLVRDVPPRSRWRHD